MEILHRLRAVEAGEMTLYERELVEQLEAARREVAAQKAEKEASGKWSRELEAERDAAVRVAAEHAEAAMVAEQKNAELEAELAELRR